MGSQDVERRRWPTVEADSAADIIRSSQPPSYDVTADGRFIMLTADETVIPTLSVVLNWTALFRPADAH